MLLVAAILLVAVLLFVGMGNASVLPEDYHVSNSKAGYLVLELPRDDATTTYDPHKATSRPAAQVHFLLGDTLLMTSRSLPWLRYGVSDRGYTILPHLAKKWEVSPDGLAYVFHLRRDVRFHSGRTLRAPDVKFTFDRLLDRETESPFAKHLGAVVGIRVVDDYTVEFQLGFPDAGFPLQLAQHFAIILDAEAVIEYGDGFGVEGFGATGPYSWVKWVPQGHLVLATHEEYDWGSPVYYNSQYSRFGK